MASAGLRSNSEEDRSRAISGQLGELIKSRRGKVDSNGSGLRKCTQQWAVDSRQLTMLNLDAWTITMIPVQLPQAESLNQPSPGHRPGSEDDTTIPQRDAIAEWGGNDIEAPAQPARKLTPECDKP